MTKIASQSLPNRHTKGDSTLAESSTGNTRLADSYHCRFFISEVNSVTSCLWLSRLYADSGTRLRRDRLQRYKKQLRSFLSRFAVVAQILSSFSRVCGTVRALCLTLPYLTQVGTAVMSRVVAAKVEFVYCREIGFPQLI
jgi:hypothetical protein